MPHWTDKVPETPVRNEPIPGPSLTPGRPGVFERLIFPASEAAGTNGLTLRLQGDWVRIRSELPFKVDIDHVEVNGFPQSVIPASSQGGFQATTGFEFLYARPFQEISLSLPAGATGPRPDFAAEAVYGQIEVLYARGGFPDVREGPPLSFGHIYTGVNANPGVDSFIYMGPVHPTWFGDNALSPYSGRIWVPSRLRIVGIQGDFTAGAANVDRFDVAIRTSDGLTDVILRTFVALGNYGLPLGTGIEAYWHHPIHVPSWLLWGTVPAPPGLGGLMFKIYATAPDIATARMAVNYEAVW